jgi:hypothetical protein
MANDLYWSDIPDENVELIFDSNSERYTGYESSPKYAAKEVAREIKERREKIAPVSEIISNHLSVNDVLEGEFTPGWGGVRKPEVIKYLMYEYERELRHRDGRLSLRPYREFRDNFEVEHLVPKNAEAGHKLENHRENRNRIGNLAVLNSQDNNIKDNTSYRKKYDEIYDESTFKILRELDEPELDLSDIESREEDIFRFVRKRWGNNRYFD